MSNYTFDEFSADRPRRKLSIFARLLLFFAAAGLLGLVLMVIGYLYILETVPKLTTVAEYKPALVTRVLSNDGRVMGEFSIERRYLTPYSDFPKNVINAFISAEDESFFDHAGINPKSILRAFIANTKAGRVVQGGSTITQQVAKTLLLSGERKYERKIKEAVLASHMERHLHKNDILFLYLNQIYLGHGAYGVEAAAKSYFRKNVADLTIAEAALLAGLVPAPSKYDPLKQPKKARVRQRYVLDRMLEEGHITEEQHKEALEEGIRLYAYDDINLKVSPYYVEHVRQYILDKYGQNELYKGGLTITTAADYDLSLRAQKAVRENLHELDKRQGYRGPLKSISKKEEQVAELKEIRWQVFQKKYPVKILPSLSEKVEKEDWVAYTYDKLKLQGLFEHDIELIKKDEIYPALVTRIESDRKSATVLIGTVPAKLPIENMKWARRIKNDETRNGEEIKYVTQAIRRNDVVLVRVKKIDDLNKLRAGKKKIEEAEVEVALEQEPVAQGALLSMEARTGRVVAMVGGYDFEKSEYNRALQGERQVGSAFKPFLYASALDKGYTASSIIVDSPLIFENQGKDDLKWMPSNNSETFYGDTTLRMALIKSRNVPSVKLLQDVEIPYFLKYAKQLGISSNLNADLSLALGSNSMTLEELTKMYALFPRGGIRVKPVFVVRVVDRDGAELESFSYDKSQEELAEFWREKLAPEEDEAEKQAELAETTAEDEIKAQTLAAAVKKAAENGGETALLNEQQKKPKKKDVPTFDDPLRAMDGKTAYLMGHLLQEVVQYGTGRKAAGLKVKVGGKTGTTNDYRDAWFVGFAPQIVTGVWTGFDTPRSLGKFETGSRASLPAWAEYMAAAVEKYPQPDLDVPKGIVFVRINAQTGRLASLDRGPAVREAFIEGTEPRAKLKMRQVPDSNNFFQEDF